MKIIKRPDGYWITDCRPDVGDMGPYESRAEADEDLRGVARSIAVLEKDEAREAAKAAKKGKQQ